TGWGRATPPAGHTRRSAGTRPAPPSSHSERGQHEQADQQGGVPRRRHPGCYRPGFRGDRGRRVRRRWRRRAGRGGARPGAPPFRRVGRVRRRPGRGAAGMSLPKPHLEELATDVLEQYLADTVADTDTLSLVDDYRDYLQARAPEYGQRDLTDADLEGLAELIDRAVAEIRIYFKEADGAPVVAVDPVAEKEAADLAATVDDLLRGV